MPVLEALEEIGRRIPGIRTYLRGRKAGESSYRFVPPGHYYSPIPSEDDIERWSKNRHRASENRGLDLKMEAQMELVASLARDYGEIPFKPQPVENLRYHFDNGFFDYADAIFLHLIIRHLKPRRIVEIGSGFSSAVMLDTVERFLGGQTRLAFIDPFAERLKSLLRPDDAKRCTVIEKAVQDVGWETFTALESGDILFVDSSHVSKAGSDVNFELFEIFPRLKPGVWIHIHDIFPGFDYPEPWLKEGRAWNEAYIVRAFLLFNESFEIILHGPLCIEKNRDWFEKNMPDCVKNTGGSLWLRRKK
jgi:predicted O-methyltransferase YrrM